MFMVTLLLHLQVQARARADIDTACGLDKFQFFITEVHYHKLKQSVVKFSDGRLSYLSVSRVEESDRNRFNTFSSDLPHATSCDDVYNSLFIPKGVLLLASQATVHIYQRDY